MKKNRGFLFILMILFLGGCGEGPRVILDPDYEIDAFLPTQESVYTPAPSDPEPTPTRPPFLISGTRYYLPTNAMSFTPPVIWVIDNESVNYVKYISRDKRAFFEAGYESTGYDLAPDAFDSYVDNAIKALYGKTEQFEILDDINEADRRIITTQFVNNGLVWKTRDVFIQQNFVVYFFSFHALLADWEYYLPGFIEIYESLEPTTRLVTNNELYEFTTLYTDPGNVFQVRKPIGWGVSDAISMDSNTRSAEIWAPDRLAAFKMYIHSPQEALTPENVGQTAIDLLRQQVAGDMTFTGDTILSDGRIRLDWVSSDQDSSGFAFFWLEGFDLYVICFVQNDGREGIYRQANYQIGDSFRFIN